MHRVVIDSQFKSLKIEDLTVTGFRAAEVTESDSLRLPASSVDRQFSS
jgi:hypothetical protein